jgi:phenylpropionate dioxygenase-like ring-hydroxylating dioxygenase large terminal subunit
MVPTHVDFNVAASVNDSSTPPMSLYTDPAVFARERDAIFRRGWIAVARSEAIAAARSYFACELVGDPIVVTRDDGGTLHAFSNVCLHRACPIAAGRGQAERGVLTCPYHRWTYGLNGQLTGAPLMDQAHGFDKSALRLPPLRVEEWLGWVFVNQDPTAAPLAPQLAALHELMAPFRVDAMIVCKTITFDSRWNWKIMVENFMESYHHMGAHPQTLNTTFPAAGTHWVDLPGAFALLENPSNDAAVAPFWVACLFPHTLFALTRGDAPTGFWYQMHLHGHDHFTLDIHLMAHRPLADDPAFVAAYVDLATAIHREDIPMCEGVWKGVNSRYAQVGRLSHLEAANWKFHQYLRERLVG